VFKQDEEVKIEESFKVGWLSACETWLSRLPCIPSSPRVIPLDFSLKPIFDQSSDGSTRIPGIPYGLWNDLLSFFPSYLLHSCVIGEVN
jgi:hypothetical protein